MATRIIKMIPYNISPNTYMHFSNKIDPNPKTSVHLGWYMPMINSTLFQDIWQAFSLNGKGWISRDKQSMPAGKRKADHAMDGRFSRKKQGESEKHKKSKKIMKKFAPSGRRSCEQA